MREDINKSVGGKVIPLNINFKAPEKVIIETPLTDGMIHISDQLDAKSSYKSQLDWEPFRQSELRTIKKPIRGGMVFKSPFKLVNSHSTCQQCLYSFEVDTYGRGCVHNCVYCYAKAELTVHGYWNNPYPVPVNINEIRKAFYTVFETDKKTKWREIMEKRIPLRIGSMSDSFMLMDNKYGVTKELLRILTHYKYPYVIFTRSDLVAQDDYMNLIDPKLAAIQFSMSSTNDSLNKLIEPGAPSAKRRLLALTKLNKEGYWTTVRINPLFPIKPDGYYTDPNFKWWGSGDIPEFNYSSFEMVDEIAATGTPAILTGFGRFSSFALNQLEKALDFDLRQFYKPNKEGVNKSRRDYHYSDAEIRYYYEQIKARCTKNAMEFTTCYIGNGETHFWKDQDIWSNKRDCCNIKSRVEAFKTDSRSIPFSSRLKFVNNKSAVPINKDTLHKPLGSLETIKLPSEDFNNLNLDPTSKDINI
jgi:DNA repair photolyase